MVDNIEIKKLDMKKCKENIYNNYPHAERINNNKEMEEPKPKAFTFYLGIRFEPFWNDIGDIFRNPKYRSIGCKSIYQANRTLFEAEIVPFVANLVDKQNYGQKQKPKLFTDYLRLYLCFCHTVAKPLFEQLMLKKDTMNYKKELDSIRGTIDMSDDEIIIHKYKKTLDLARQMIQQIDCQIV